MKLASTVCPRALTSREPHAQRRPAGLCSRYQPTILNPKGCAASETYHHDVEVSGNVRTLDVAGQIGIQHDGTIPEGIEAQTRVLYANMRAVLEAADMTFADV